jgi:hypothetical protein
MERVMSSCSRATGLRRPRIAAARATVIAAGRFGFAKY